MHRKSCFKTCCGCEQGGGQHAGQDSVFRGDRCASAACATYISGSNSTLWFVATGYVTTCYRSRFVIVSGV